MRHIAGDDCDISCCLRHNVSTLQHKGPIPRLRISISIRIAYAYKKLNKLNNIGAILVVRISIRINFVRKQRAYRIAQ